MSLLLSSLALGLLTLSMRQQPCSDVTCSVRTQKFHLLAGAATALVISAVVSLLGGTALSVPFTQGVLVGAFVMFAAVLSLEVSRLRIVAGREEQDEVLRRLRDVIAEAGGDPDVVPPNLHRCDHR